MIDQAIEKINAEMQKNPSDPYVEIIGHYVIDRCGDEAAAAKVCAEKKTLAGAMKAVAARASKVRNGRQVAPLTPGDVFGEMDRYFGLPTDLPAQWKAIGAPVPGAEPGQTAAQEAPARVTIAFEDFF